jgi:hypothetical protein
MKFRSFETPDSCTGLVRMRKTAIFVWRTRDVTLHDGCHRFPATIKMVACDVTDRLGQSEEAIYTKFSWETSHRDVRNRRTNEILCFSCWWNKQPVLLNWAELLTVSIIPGKGALCAHASLYYVKGSKFRNVSPEALSYRRGLFKLLVARVSKFLLGYDAV